MTDRLGNKQIAALLALMSLAREVSNTELAEITGFRLDGEERRQLNELKYVTSRRERGNTPYLHELTDQGWAWCANELTEPRPPRPYSFGGALYAVLGGLDRFLKRKNLRLADVFQLDVAISRDQLEAHIRRAYGELASGPGDQVRLADLRPSLNGASRADVDAVLEEMSRTQRVNLFPDSDTKSLTAGDRAAAIHLGNEDNHLIAIEGP
jgi:hypothetical protein